MKCNCSPARVWINHKLFHAALPATAYTAISQGSCLPFNLTLVKVIPVAVSRRLIALLFAAFSCPGFELVDVNRRQVEAWEV